MLLEKGLSDFLWWRRQVVQRLNSGGMHRERLNFPVSLFCLSVSSFLRLLREPILLSIWVGHCLVIIDWFLFWLVYLWGSIVITRFIGPSRLEDFRCSCLLAQLRALIPSICYLPPLLFPDFVQLLFCNWFFKLPCLATNFPRFRSKPTFQAGCFWETGADVIEVCFCDFFLYPCDLVAQQLWPRPIARIQLPVYLQLSRPK